MISLYHQKSPFTFKKINNSKDYSFNLLVIEAAVNFSFFLKIQFFFNVDSFVNTVCVVYFKRCVTYDFIPSFNNAVTKIVKRMYKSKKIDRFIFFLSILQRKHYIFRNFLF